MYGFEYPKGMSVGRVCLEMSFKPFLSVEQGYVNNVIKKLFEGWRGLLRYASGCAVMLWIGDGSEILTYTGDMDAEIEWAKYLGMANPPANAPEFDPQRLGIHAAPRLYTRNPAQIKVRDIKRIVDAIKSIGKAETGLDISVGATFDPGPEFALSPFKCKEHTEISSQHAQSEIISAGWVRCTARLHGDNNRYAAYPEGIPEGLHIGAFLGAQYRAFSRDLGFDYIWLSNGFGFSRDSWNWTGECFDGDVFDYERSRIVSGQIIEFWQELTAACPGIRIETRGSNLSTGMDIAAHGSPLAEIYKYIPFAPPNSPWAALDAQYGLELSGYMSHIAKTPPEGFLFRYYTHDPWWVNSPWFDRYNRQPHDIYMPLQITRLDGDMNAAKPCGINILTADDSFGEMPFRCPTEVVPYLLDAWSHSPDEPGLITWVYPFDFYNEIGFSKRSREAFFGDWLIKSGLDCGMPLGGVISDESYIKCASRIAGRTILVMPVPDSCSALERALLLSLENGCDVILYGSIDFASRHIRDMIGVNAGEADSGVFNIKSNIILDTVQGKGLPDKLLHTAGLSSGGVNTFAPDKSRLLVALEKGGREYAYCTFNENAKSGRLCWIRGSFPGIADKKSRLPGFLPDDLLNPGELFRGLLAFFGVKIAYSRDEMRNNPPMMIFSRHQNAYFATCYAPDTTQRMSLSLPCGAPVFTGHECIIENSAATYSLPRWMHAECRVFVKQAARSKVGCVVQPSVYPGVDRRLYVTGLIDADVTFSLPPGVYANYVQRPLSRAHSDDDKFLTTNIPVIQSDGKAICKGINGSLMISFGTGEKYPPAQ